MEIMQIVKRTKYKSSGKILMIPVNEIQPNPDQPRREFSYEKLLELAQSISENGLLQPISVTLKDNKPVLVAGERRLRAAKIAGIKEIPCLVIEADQSRAALLALLENLQREDMNCFEEAEGIKKLINDYGLTQEEVAHQLGFAQSTIANRMRILKLSEEERNIIIKEGLTERHARALIRLDGEQRKSALMRIVQQNLNVAQTERLVEEILEKSKPKEKRRPAMPLIRDVRLFLNTVNNAIDTMRRSGIDASAEKIETDDYIEYFVRIPKRKNSAETKKLQRQHITA